MKRALLALALSALSVPMQHARAEEVPALYRGSVTKGLDYLVSTQYPDGHWEARGGMYPSSMTALAGMALLMEGSTVRDGKYASQIRKAADWFMDRSQRNGLLVDSKHPSESHYVHGHGYALLFLAQVYGEEDDGARRQKLQGILTRAVEFSGKAQTSHGGWGYVTAAEGGDADEGSTTITQLQALRAARNVGIVVPKSIVDRAVGYLKACTTSRGGIVYKLADGTTPGTERPALTAAAVACIFASGDYQSDYARKLLKFCQGSIPLGGAASAGFFGHWEYTHYYYAQSLYLLGDKGYARMFPESKEANRLTWSKYRETTFAYLAARQAPDGSWNLSGIGPVYSTACCLAILQLDNAALPIYQR